MLNIQSAITYNNACNYPSNVINIILKAVGGPMAWQWNDPGVTAVFNWQKSNNLTADGMVGTKSLNRLIYELDNCGKSADANQIRQFIAQAKADQAAKQNEIKSIISSFPQPSLIYPFGFTREGADWAARGTFEVNIKLNSSLSEDERMRYEYRQFIKGDAWVEDGQGHGANWQQTQPRVYIRKQFDVPPDPARDNQDGLTLNWKEDGKFPEVLGSSVFRFGYRNGQVKNGERFKNKWYPNPISGSKFVLRDSPGYGATYYSNIVPKLHMEFNFCGMIVEVEEVQTQNDIYTQVVRKIDEKQWKYTFEQIRPW